MQNVLPSDRRLIRRRHLIFHLRVFDRDSNQKLGHVVDISPEGLMLVSEQPIPTDTSFNLRMQLPDENDTPRDHEFEARSVWSNNDIKPQFYDTGFQVLQASDKHMELVEHLVDDYGFRD